MSAERVTEIKGNLFSVLETNPNYSLCHCVGNDFSTGAGIAVEFKRRFGMQKDLIASSRGVGTCCLLKKKHINIFYLVTKEFSSRYKPTLSSLSDSLEDMVLITKNHSLS
jgi:hypothetical protein